MVSINKRVEFPSLETERLHLKLLTLQDSKAVFKHFSDEEIIRFHQEDSGCRWGLFDKKIIV